MTIDPRPRRFPPPEFPARRPTLFARTPPAIFSPLLGFLVLAMALHLALERLRLHAGAAELVAGVAVALWLFAAVAYLGKLARRPGVVVEDLRVLPGRTGLAAMTMGGMVAAGLIAPYLPVAALSLLLASLVGHAVLALLLIRLLIALPRPGREVNPTWHVSFVGFIAAAPGLFALNLPGLAEALFWAVLPVAVGIWVLSGLQFIRSVPPAPLRPLLAIHAAPAALLATMAALLGKPDAAIGFLALASVYALALALSVRWLVAFGPSPLWGSFTFPLAALANAMLVMGANWDLPGLILVVVCAGVIPAILWWVWKRWPGGKLASLTNAAEA